MPVDRFLHKRAGSSFKLSSLDDLQFRVWTQYLLSCDDFGVLICDASVLRADNACLRRRPERLIQKCLEALIDAGLLRVFEHQGSRYCYQWDWQNWQRVGYPTTTLNPAPPASALEACSPATRLLFSVHPGGGRERVPRHLDAANVREGDEPTVDQSMERDIEGRLFRALPSWLGPGAEVRAQARLGNMYCDLVATYEDTTFAIEVKRSAITDAAVAQVIRYATALREAGKAGIVIPVVVGQTIGLHKPLPEPVMCITLDTSGVFSVVKSHPGDRYLTSGLSLFHSRGREMANGLRPTANGSPSEKKEGRAPLDAWFAELLAAYPEARVTRGFMTQSAFMAALDAASREPSIGTVEEAWALMRECLAANVRSHEWRVKGMTPKLEKYLREGLWRNRLPAEPPVAERLSDQSSVTLHGASAFVMGGSNHGQ